jgi:hypothetical protein
MSQHYFVLNSPPISFSKSDLYKRSENMSQISPYIKAISDAFFLSNSFRKNLCLYFYTRIKKEPTIISFEGSSLRYLGPSFFSAAHLLIRAINSRTNPNSKKGKLTPGLSVYEEELDWILEKHTEHTWVQVSNTDKQEELPSNVSLASPVLFLFGFDNVKLEKIEHKISWPTLEIDEQVILTNHYIESVN